MVRTGQCVLISTYRQPYRCGFEGSIVHCKLLHQHVIILNDPDTAFALLDRKGSIYSDRPELYMANKLIGWEGAPALTSANAHHRTMRTMMARTVGTKALLRKYEPMLMFETKRFLRKVLREPENLYAHVRWYALSGRRSLVRAFAHLHVGSRVQRY